MKKLIKLALFAFAFSVNSQVFSRPFFVDGSRQTIPDLDKIAEERKQESDRQIGFDRDLEKGVNDRAIKRQVERTYDAEEEARFEAELKALKNDEANRAQAKERELNAKEDATREAHEDIRWGVSKNLFRIRMIKMAKEALKNTAYESLTFDRVKSQKENKEKELTTYELYFEDEDSFYIARIHVGKATKSIPRLALKEEVGGPAFELFDAKGESLFVVEE